MNVEIYINAVRADYGEKINVQYAIGDIKDILSGRNNKSFEIALPRTDTNRALFQHIDSVTVFDELTAAGYVSVDGAIIIQGKVILQSVTKEAFNIIITADDWVDVLKGLSIRDLDLSAHDHVYNATNQFNSWPGNLVYLYPLINFGKWSDPNSSTTGELGADTYVMDYYPAIRIEEIFLKILEPWIVNSDLTGATKLFRKHFLFGSPPVKDNDFIQDKDFDAYVDSDADNQDSVVIAPAATDQVDMIRSAYGSRMEIDAETTDIGNDFITDRYTVPETGTYRFVLKIQAVYTWTGSGVPNSQSLTYRIYRRRAAADTMLAEFTTSSLGSWQAQQTLDTSRIHCVANDEIWVYAVLTMEFTNADGGDRTLTASIKSGAAITHLYNVMDEFCLFPGEGITVDVEQWLPDISQIDFLRGLKHMFNLRFAVDRNAGTMRVETADDFYNIISGQERDWTEYIDNINIEQKMISIEYAGIQRFKFMNDENDFALKSYLEDNRSLPGDYDHTLSSVYAKGGVDERINPAFADTSEGIMRPLGWWTTDIARIWGEVEEGFPFPQQRIRAWKARIFWYYGASSSPAAFWYEGSNYASYPKVTIENWTDLFGDYWVNTYHLIDSGKLVMVQANIPVSEIQRFATVVGTEDREGFRAQYKVKIGDDTFLATVNRIVYNGVMAKVEFIILK